ncbi:JAB domain-containing protein [Parapedobacter soli]|uniref:JAB domain-containing protein n=1 Tax=Parapedobacter soli TaxID=416955 RepID=UPI0021CA75E2|nr:JAB domain-containing protein [Parapedobacter soli]
MQTTLNFESAQNYSNQAPQTEMVANEFVLKYKKSEHINSLNKGELNSSIRIANFLRTVWDEDRLHYQESFYVLYFTNGMKLSGFFKIADGTIDGVPVDMKLMFTNALLSGSHKIILAHNHPSGTLKPSSADLAMTKKAAEAGELLSIEVVDHIILTPESHYSFRDEGLL